MHRRISNNFLSLFTFPRKGTETVLSRFNTRFSRLSLFTFPRKGTETDCGSFLGLVLSYHYLHFPVRGRKWYALTVFVVDHVQNSLFTFPRKGTETANLPGFYVHYHFASLFTFPRKGTETLMGMISIATDEPSIIIYISP